MSKVQVSLIKIVTPIQLGQFGPNLAKTWSNLVQLTHFVAGVGSSNFIYALTVVITFRNILLPKVLGLYFQSWLFWADLAQIWPKSGPNLAQIWPKSGPIWSI